MSATIRAGVLTVSDRCAAGASQDASGPAVCALLEEHLGVTVSRRACVPDSIPHVREHVLEWAGAGVRLIVTTGGTGLAPTDVTPEAVGPILDRHAPGLMELARIRCLEKTALTFLSRGVAGTIGTSLVITLPGSPRGAADTLSALLDVLPHALAIAGGENAGH